MLDKDVLYSTGNYSVLCNCLSGKNLKKQGYKCMYNWFTLLNT